MPMEERKDILPQWKTEVLRVLHERKSGNGRYILRICRLTHNMGAYPPMVVLQKKYATIKNGELRMRRNRSLTYFDLQILWNMKDDIEQWFRANAPEYVEDWHQKRLPRATK